MSEPVVLDVAGRRLELPREQALRLHAAASADAGRSSRARDLSLRLERALQAERPRPLVLRPGERQTLARLAGEEGLDELAAALHDDHAGETAAELG